MFELDYALLVFIMTILLVDQNLADVKKTKRGITKQTNYKQVPCAHVDVAEFRFRASARSSKAACAGDTSSRREHARFLRDRLTRREKTGAQT